MLTTKESEALIAAIRLLKTWGGEALSQSLESAQEKMLAILPEARRARRSRPACLPLTLARIAMLKPILTLSIRPYPISRYYSFTTRMNPVR